ncbi:arylsulfatase [Pedobacter endophyticus]|uniref:Arylsulfatase n=2 Tax=Pedobacter endophyticus TaxID=2789740 RepID=A0A7S9L3I0_9SPHI|nr:arylsulfatase [Pedobacter endophyticus]
MKTILKIILCLLIVSLKGYAQNLHPKRLPNIIYIYADDLGYAETGPYGQKKIRTPNLDKLAKEGMKFTQHYTATPVCAPARCMLMTGKHGGHSYIRGNYEMGGFPDSLEGGQMPLPERTFTIPVMLKKAGYVSALTGKWGLGMNNSTGSPLKQGFDYYYGYLDQKQAHNFYPSHLWENDLKVSLDNPYINVHRPLDSTNATDKDFEYYKGRTYSQDMITKKAIQFINKQGKKPFFLYMPYNIPHVSLQVPDAYTNKYVGQFKEQPYYGQQGYAPAKYPYSTYAAMITYLDEQIGIIMAEIKKLGLDNDTIIMFSSDNGTTFNGGVNAKFFNSVDGMKGLKMDVFEGGIREPFIARWPGKIPANTTSDFISVQFDMMATFAEIAGVETNNTDGISLLPTLLGKNEKQQQREYIYWEYPEKGGQLAIRMGNWKGVRLNLWKDLNNPWMIFNLKNDRNETEDLSSQHPELAKRFDEIVKKEHQVSHINEWEFLESKMKKN